MRAGSIDLRYDFDNDGDVDGDDLTALAAGDLETGVGVGTARGDFNLDGVIDIEDVRSMMDLLDSKK